MRLLTYLQWPWLSWKVFVARQISRADIFDVPAERLIAEGRIVFCALSLCALYLDPDQLGSNAPWAYRIFWIYSIFAVGLIAVRVWRLPSRATGYVVHGIDAACLAMLTFMADGRQSPFLAFFAFVVLLAASLRWNWQAVVRTAFALALLLIAITVVDPSGAVANINQAMVRGAFLITAGAMLAFSSAVRERRREQLAALTDWPGPDASQINSPNLTTLLAHCARVLEAPRVLVAWEEAEEPFVNIAAWDNGRYQHTRDVAGAFGEFVQPERFVSMAFWTDDATTKFAVTSEGPVRLQGPVIDRGLVEAFQIGTCATAPFEGTFCKGRVFILDRSNWTEFQNQLAQIIAARVANALDRQIMQGDAREAAAERERARLTRDLHDGLLQSLTAAGLQIRLLADNEEGDARARLEVVQQLLNSEQRRVRDFVRRAPPPQAIAEDVAVNSSLGEVLAETARHWSCTASLVVEPEHARIPATLCVHVSLMLAEAVANAVRHGGASRVDVTVKQTADQGLVVGVRDNGRGFNGRSFSYADMDVLPAGMGPYSLRERVRELGGSLGLSSSSAGVDLQIRLQVA